MNKLIAILLLMISAGLAQADGVVIIKALRDGAPLDAEAAVPEPRHWQADRNTIPRQYVQQPPLIPHSIESYTINLKFNKCLTCHSWANYKATGAVKISMTHFSDREGHDLANVAARRYVCTQCHIPQMDAPPLVENDFRPVRALVPPETE
jgi:cytochrome c-type protein NapB